MAEISPLRRRMIEDMDGPQSVAGDATILRACGREVQPVFQSVAGPARPAYLVDPSDFRLFHTSCAWFPSSDWNSAAVMDSGRLGSSSLTRR